MGGKLWVLTKSAGTLGAPRLLDREAVGTYSTAALPSGAETGNVAAVPDRLCQGFGCIADL